MSINETFIIAAKRTPTGSFLGALSSFSATTLGAIAIKSAYSAANISPDKIDSVYMGNVLAADLGQSPARQAAIGADISAQTDCTTVNKVCAAGLKAVMLGAQQIQLGLEDIVVAGGMESMSNAPHYQQIRHTTKLGNTVLTDGLLKDGLTDAYRKVHMGEIAELCAAKYKITREQQDHYAYQSYAKAAAASKSGKFTSEIIPLKINTGKTEITLAVDEDVTKLIPEKVPTLRPVFVENGTITAANASNLNDGAAALVLASQHAVSEFGLKPVAKIIASADAATDPDWFTIAPALAIPKALKRAGLNLEDIDCFEINEAYAAVILANQQLLGLDSNKVNLYGGAVAMGHPLGASGARILCTLISALQQEGGRYGLAAICNGGGGASALIIEIIS